MYKTRLPEAIGFFAFGFILAAMCFLGDSDGVLVPAVVPVPNEPIVTEIDWENLSSPQSHMETYRTKIPDGWLVFTTGSRKSTMVSISDPNRRWLIPEEELKAEERFFLYVAADRATFEAVRPAVLEISRQNPNDQLRHLRLLRSWRYRIDAAESSSGR